MITITQDEFVNDYNLYDTDDFEIDYDKETIKLY